MYELYLVDEVLKDPDFYRTNVRDTPGYKILDNSLNELGFARGLEQMDEAASIINPDEFVIPDSVDADVSASLLSRCKSDIDMYSHLRGLRKMAVLHGRGLAEQVKSYSKLSSDSFVDVIGIPKVLADLSGRRERVGRAQMVSALGRPQFKEIHFLGFAGFAEFQGCESVTYMIRSMDSRVMLEPGVDLFRREDLLSHVSLGEDRFIEGVQDQIDRVRGVYESYGLR